MPDLDLTPELNVNEQEVQTIVGPNATELEMINAMIADLDKKSDEEDTTVRFKSAAWYDKVKESSILCVGQGGIGRKV